LTNITESRRVNMSIGVVVDFRFKADSPGAGILTDVLKERLPSITRKADGCEFVHLYADPDDSNHMVILGRWESRDKYEKYREWAMALPGTTEALAYLDGDPAWTYLDDTGA
jgi:quinol monooxygenase YgiN